MCVCVGGGGLTQFPPVISLIADCCNFIIPYFIQWGDASKTNSAGHDMSYIWVYSVSSWNPVPKFRELQFVLSLA